jgi:hypothetical protein
VLKIKDKVLEVIIEWGLKMKTDLDYLKEQKITNFNVNEFSGKYPHTSILAGID